MSAEKLVEKRLRHFWQQIRAQQIQKIFQFYRQNLVFSHISAKVIPTLCFPQHNARPQIVSKVLNQYRQMLISPFKQQMVDENSPNSQISTQLHVNFWQQCLFWLDKNKPHKLYVIPQLKSFILQLKQSFSWQPTCISEKLLDIYMELIQKLCFQFQDQVKKSLAQWISHVKYIPLIQKLFTSAQAFPSPNQYPNIYKIIKQALNSKVTQYHKNSAKFILQISRFANSSQNFLIFQYDATIFSRLYQLLDRNSHSIEAINYWPPVFYLLNNYSPVIEFSVNEGLLGICCKLIRSNLQDSIFGALAILKVLSCGQNQVLAVIKNNLSQNEENWLSDCLDRNVFNHMKVDISKLFFQIIRNLILWSNETQLIALCSIFQNKRKSILGMICWVWQTSHKDEDIVNYTLQCVSALMIWNQILLFDEQSVQVFLGTKNMIPFITKCSISENHNISDIASCIIDQMDRISRKKEKSFI